MDWLEVDSEDCSIRRALEAVGEKWTLLILRDAANGVRRFDDFHRHVGLSQAVLADRLRKLVASGILRTTPYREPGSRTRHEYRMTRKGWDLWPVLVALMQWGDAYAAGPDGPPLRLRHRDCGAPVRAAVVCCAEETPVEPSRVHVEFGRAAPAGPASPARTAVREPASPGA
ncbi:helix-turn-helix domain-containing protein [Streptomyces cuspidosporus]|uniref:Helix-turn-helix domain-containing protein n=1 Tax=Streptomyces cuspidosporus TaxID=66882 RepID=A0ABN3FRC6_9ACTN